MKESDRMRLDGVLHVVWDWNGTLLDDTWLCLEIANHMLADRGLGGLSKTRYQEIFDFPVVRYYERMGFDFRKEPFEQIALEFIRAYETRRLEATLQSEARETLASLAGRGFTQSILSNYPHDTLETILGHHGIRDVFHDVIGSDDIFAHGKQERGQRWLARQGWAPWSVVLVGDTAHDFEVAAAMGIRGALVTTGSHSRGRLEKLGAPVFDSLRAFAEAL